MATLFVENLTVVDFSYLHAKRGMVGESWIVDLELSGDLDAQGMVFDFGHIKKGVKRTVDDEVDHRLLIPADSEVLTLRQRDNDQHSLEWRYPGGEIRLLAPASSLLALPGLEISKAGVTRYLIEKIRALLPDNVTDIQVRLREEATGTAPFYHYSHGLKKHDGNCQRIAHGHRSGIQIFENDRRSRYWEKLWADRWEDIYIGSREDLEGTYYVDEVPHHRFRYDAPQGHFELVIPEDHCYLVDTDTTVERLAEHIAEQLAREAPGKQFRVRAFEGVGKGAIANAGENNPGRSQGGWLTGNSVLNL
ncbi:6-pyruvoyl tetrahydropterin reductase [Alcanivorax sp. N3-2A]|nr:6-pyruvoyl tetrahydropterin reductase [Alcanivorax sp. N3-2A]|tara:strand:+ start:12460 stop:13377 length:918 start_codon:yes stop_codon:yes gene_type:complete